ncbi:response regulator [bacterium]|nr:response regulator [bacterium]NBS51413.1 response regulator [Spartobacteria bacterium]
MNIPKILSLEDSPMVQSLIENAFSSYDVELHFASNGEEGLHMARKLVPDVILLDLKMPVMDGVEFLEKLRAERQFQATPVLVVSAQNVADYVIKLARLRISGFILKPFDDADLIARVGKIVKLWPLSGRSSPSNPTAVLNSPHSSTSYEVKSAASTAKLTLHDIQPKTQIKSAKEILIHVTKSSFEDGERHTNEDIMSLGDKIDDYILKLGYSNAHVLGFVLELFTKGKVRLDFRAFSERLELQNPAFIMSRTEAASLFEEHIKAGQRSKGGACAAETQKIILPPR